jgi:hypothetical protein
MDDNIPEGLSDGRRAWEAAVRRADVDDALAQRDAAREMLQDARDGEGG